MALDGVTSTFLPYTLNGLQDLSVDSSTFNSLQITSLAPNRAVVSNGSDSLISAGASSDEVDFLIGTSSNIQTQLNSKADTLYLDTNFFNKTSSTAQIVVGATTFNSSVTLGNATALTVPVFDGDKKITSSGISTTELNTLNGISSNVQSQLNSKLNLSGGDMTGDIRMDIFKVTSAVNPTTADTLTRRGWVDDALALKGDLSYINSQNSLQNDAIALKANTSDVNESLSTKASLLYVDSQNDAQNIVIGGKANTSDVASSLLLKADKTYVDSQNSAQDAVIATKVSSTDLASALALKSDLSYVNSEISQLTYLISQKADSTGTSYDLSLKADKTYVDQQDNALATLISSKVSTNDFNTALALKGNISYIDSQNSAQDAVIASKISTVDATALLALKTSFSYVDGKNDSQDIVIASKANASDVASSLLLKSDISYTNSQLALRDSAIALRALSSDVTAGLAQKLNLAGGTLTGTVYNSGGNFHAYKGSDTNNGVYLFGNSGDGASYDNFNGGIGSWYGIALYSSLDNTCRIVFDTRTGNSSHVGTITAGAFTTAGNLTLSGLTASKALYLNASGVVKTSTVSDVELGYLNGVTSSIQTQLNSKASSGTLGDYATVTQLSTGLALKMNLVGGNTITGPQFYNDAVASRVAVFDGYKGLTYSSVSTTTLAYLDATSSVQTQLNSKANSSLLSNYLPLTGGVLTGDLNLSTLTAGKALYIDGSKNIRTSTTTSTELSYLTNVTSPIQSQLNVISAGRISFPRRDDKRTGLAPSNQEAESLSYWFGTFANGTGTFSDMITLNSWADSSGGAVNMIAFNRGDKGIRQFQGTYGSTSNFSTYYDCVMTDANSSNVGITGTLSVGLASNVTPNIKFANSLNHITGNESEAYLFNGTNGYIAVGRNTTRSSTEANLHMGTLGTDCSVESIASNGSKYLPMGYYASKHIFKSGPVNIAGNTPYAVDANYMLEKGSLTLGSTTNNYGGGTTGWTSNTAGILMECDERTEIAVHDAGARVASFMYYEGNRFTIGRNMVWGVTPVTIASDLTVNGAIYGNSTIRAYANGDGGPSMIYSQNDSAGNGYALMHLRNNTGSGCYWFLNSSTRAADGGANTTTLRNDVGALRLQSNGGNGIMIASTSGYVGIGTTSPGNQFYNYSGNTTGWAGWGYFGNSTTGVVIGTYNNEAYLGGHNGALNAWTNLNVCAGGNLGVGGVNAFYKANIEGKLRVGTGAGQDFLTLEAPTSTGGDSIRINFSHSGISNYIESYKVFGLNRAVLRFFATDSVLNSVEMINITDSGTTCFGNWYTAGSAWCGNVSTLGNGCSTFSQGYDRWLCYANGSGTGGGYAYYNQNGSLGTISDRRIKKDFQAITEDQSITFIKALEPTSFCLKEQETCIRKTTDKDGNEIEEKIYPSVCGCRQDGWIAQNVLEACDLSGAPKSVVNHWYDYEQELEKPEEERTTLIGVSDRPILSHTVNVVKSLLNKIETLTQRNQLLEDHARKLESDLNEYKEQTDRRMTQLAELIKGILEEPKLKRSKTLVKE